MWGDDDAVSPMTIPAALAGLIEPSFLTVKTMKNTGEICEIKKYFFYKFHFLGHFVALEKPDEWSRNILEFVDSVDKNSKSQVDIR